jgi:hypothetical protein
VLVERASGDLSSSDIAREPPEGNALVGKTAALKKKLPTRRRSIGNEPFSGLGC